MNKSMLLLFNLFLASLQPIVSMEHTDLPGSLLPELTGATDFEQGISTAIQEINFLARQMESELIFDTNFYANHISNPSTLNQKILKEFVKKRQPKESTKHLLIAIRELTSSMPVNITALENIIAGIPSFKIKFIAGQNLWESKTDDYKRQMFAFLELQKQAHSLGLNPSEQ